MEKIKVCVTGSTGFIGQHLISLLKKNKLLKVAPFVGNLLKEEDIAQFFSKQGKIDCCIHLAGGFEGDFQRLTELNMLTTFQVAKYFPDYGCSQIIYSSTGAVYGEPQGDQSFETDVLEPNTEYGLSKMLAEQMLQFWQKTKRFNAVILRFPNVYGPGNTKNVLYKFMKAIQDTKKIILFGTGEQKRDFLYVNDACQALEKAIFFEGSEVFNISSSATFSLNEIIHILEEKYQFTVEKQPSEDKVQQLKLNYQKAVKVLQYSPNHPNLEL